MLNATFQVNGNNVDILIPEGMVSLEDSAECPAPNWRRTISITDTATLALYLTAEQMATLQGS